MGFQGYGSQGLGQGFSSLGGNMGNSAATGRLNMSLHHDMIQKRAERSRRKADMERQIRAQRQAAREQVGLDWAKMIPNAIAGGVTGGTSMGGALKQTGVAKGMGTGGDVSAPTNPGMGMSDIATSNRQIMADPNSSVNSYLNDTGDFAPGGTGKVISPDAGKGLDLGIGSNNSSNPYGAQMQQFGPPKPGSMGMMPGDMMGGSGLGGHGGLGMGGGNRAGMSGGGTLGIDLPGSLTQKYARDAVDHVAGGLSQDARSSMVNEITGPQAPGTGNRVDLTKGDAKRRMQRQAQAQAAYQQAMKRAQPNGGLPPEVAPFIAGAGVNQFMQGQQQPGFNKLQQQGRGTQGIMPDGAQGFVEGEHDWMRKMNPQPRGNGIFINGKEGQNPMYRGQSPQGINGAAQPYLDAAYRQAPQAAPSQYPFGSTRTSSSLRGALMGFGGPEYVKMGLDRYDSNRQYGLDSALNASKIGLNEYKMMTEQARARGINEETVTEQVMREPKFTSEYFKGQDYLSKSLLSDAKTQTENESRQPSINLINEKTQTEKDKQSKYGKQGSLADSRAKLQDEIRKTIAPESKADIALTDAKTATEGTKQNLNIQKTAESAAGTENKYQQAWNNYYKGLSSEVQAGIDQGKLTGDQLVDLVEDQSRELPPDEALRQMLDMAKKDKSIGARDVLNIVEQIKQRKPEWMTSEELKAEERRKRGDQAVDILGQLFGGGG